ncbi:MAG: ABC transporter substrate-binding protein [Eubacteriales bacterium]|nr:ABC transporter substrate-binding protein [Eubacteriales bacterium]
MKQTRKMALFMASMLTTMELLAGCGAKAPVETPAEAVEEEKITLRFFSALPDRTTGLGLLEEKMLNIYREEHPNVILETEYLQDEPYKVKMQTYMQSGNMPDVWQQFGYGALLEPVAKGNFAMELNPADYDDYGFVPGALETYTVDGKLIGLPRNADYEVLYYNKKTLDDYGIPVPKTTDDLIEAAKKLEGTGIYAVSLTGKDKWPIGDVLSSLVLRTTTDASVLKRAVTTASLSSTPEVSQGFDEFIRLVDNGVFQPSFASDDYGTAKNLFVQGKTAMYMMGSWEMGMGSDENIPEEVRNNIRAVAFPLINGKEGTDEQLALWFGGGYAASSSSKHPKEAQELLEMLVKPENYVKIGWEEQLVIPPMNYEQYMTGNETPLQKDMTDILNTAKDASGDCLCDYHTPEYKNASEVACLEFATKMITTEEFCQRLDEAAKAALK